MRCINLRGRDIGGWQFRNFTDDNGVEKKKDQASRSLPLPFGSAGVDVRGG